MHRADDSAANHFGWLLRAAHYVSLTLIAIATAVMLVALLQDRFIDREPSSSPSRQTESPLTNPAWQHPGVTV